MRHPTNDDPLGMVDTREKLRASELRTLYCVAELIRLAGDSDIADDFSKDLAAEDFTLWAAAEKEVHACVGRVYLGCAKKRIYK